MIDFYNNFSYMYVVSKMHFEISKNLEEENILTCQATLQVKSWKKQSSKFKCHFLSKLRQTCFLDHLVTGPYFWNNTPLFVPTVNNAFLLHMTSENAWMTIHTILTLYKPYIHQNSRCTKMCSVCTSIRVCWPS